MTAPVDLSQLLTVLTKESSLSTILAAAQSLRFKVTSWRSGGIGLTVSNILADLVVQASLVVPQIARSGFLDLALGQWLDLLAYDYWDETKDAATKTTGTMLLTSSDGAPPYTIANNSTWVQDDAGLLFLITVGGTLASGSSETLAVTVEAEKAGSDYNIPTDSDLSFVTELPGVTVTNPDPGTGDWISSPGTDEEERASLIAKCRAKWATISYEEPAQAYEYWARAADSSVTRVYVDDNNPDGPGTLRVYVAGSSGAITDSAVITAVGDYIEARKAPGAQTAAYSATNKTITLSGTVYGSTTTAALQTAVEASLSELEQSIDIGGEQIGVLTDSVFRDSIIHAIRSSDGVEHVDLTAPSGDTALTDVEVPVFSVAGLSYSVS